jgi:hypothetical protein
VKSREWERIKVRVNMPPDNEMTNIIVCNKLSSPLMGED